MEDKEKQIEEMAKSIEYAINNECKLNNGKSCEDCVFDNKGDWHCQNLMIATHLYGERYRKLPKDSVVLSREDMKKYAKDCIAGQETGLDIINALIARAERYKEKAKQARKETVEKILKDLIKNCQYTFGVNGKPIIALDGDFALNTAKSYGVEIKE